MRNKKGQFIKGHKVSKKFRIAVAKSSSLRRGIKHPNWKDNEVGYFSLHAWVNRWLGKPRLCELCKTTSAKRFEWANISGQYKRDLTDWIRLCKKCHNKYDHIYQKMWTTRHYNIEAKIGVATR